MLTFDNAAAKSLKDKLEESLQEADANPDGFAIKTLNSFGFGILRAYFKDEHRNIDLARVRRLMSEVKDALKSRSPERFALLPPYLERRFYLDFFSLLKNKVYDPRDFNAQALANDILAMPQAEIFFAVDQAPTTRIAIIQSIMWMFAALEKALQHNNLLDFDDQKLRALQCLRADPAALQTVQGQYTEIIVDEFQDVNRLDFELIGALAERATLVVTGDDDQAIYGFRGCSPDYIINLARYLGSVESFELSKNYRSPKNIVEKATRLIRHNTRRIEKHPIAHRQEDAAIKVVAAKSSVFEARLIVSHIKKIKKGNADLGFRDFAVLYRTNAQSLPIQVEFVLNDIPYLVRDEDNIVRNEVLEKLLAVLRVKLALRTGGAVKPRDAALSISAYFQYLSRPEFLQLEGLFDWSPDYLSVIGSQAFFDVLPKAESSNFVKTLLEVVDAKSLLEALDVMARGFKGLRGMIGSLEDAVKDRVPLGEVYELAASFKGNTARFVETLDKALVKARELDSGKDAANGVSLLSYFKAKGLQWHTVILSSCNQGLIPHKRAPLEDERRLFYVAMTRASANLLVSHLNESCTHKVTPSQFLAEAGLHEP